MQELKQPTYIRQRYVLALLNQIEDDGIQMTYLQKIVFLNEKVSRSSYYDFIPYKYGPYSFQLAEDIETLCRNGQIYRDEKGFHARIPSEFGVIFSIPKERGKDLVRRAYREYPYYAMNSVILGELFSKEEIGRFQNNKMFQNNVPGLYTIGYEGKSLESFINILINNDIKVLCDVRKNPLSRKFGFSKSKLEHVLPSVNIVYISIPELGIESEKRADLSTDAAYKVLFDDYRNNINKKELFLRKLYDIYKDNKKIALMCYEKDSKMCHRHIIRDVLVERYGVRSVDL